MRDKQWARDLAASIHRVIESQEEDRLGRVEVAEVLKISPDVLIQPEDDEVTYEEEEITWGIDPSQLRVGDTVLMTRDTSDNIVVSAVLDGNDPDPTNHPAGAAMAKTLSFISAKSRFWAEPVPTLTELNSTTTDADGTVRLVEGSDTLYRWNLSTSTWVSISGGGGATDFTGLTGVIAATQITNGSIPLAKLAVDPLARANHTGTQLASTISDFSTAVNTLLSPYAPLASPTFTGTPAAPTAAVDTNTTQLATTGYVVGQGYLKSATAASTYLPLAGGTMSGPIAMGSQDITAIGTLSWGGDTTLARTSAGVMNLVSGSGVKLDMNSKTVVQSADTWLRMNPDGDFTGGTYFGTGASAVVRTDHEFHIGSAGASFKASSSGITFATALTSTTAVAQILNSSARSMLRLVEVGPYWADSITTNHVQFANATYNTAIISGLSGAILSRLGVTATGTVFSSGPISGIVTPTTLVNLQGTGVANGITFGHDAAGSVNLYRVASDILATDDSMRSIGGQFDVQRTSTSAAFSSFQSGDAQKRFQITAAGSVSWGDGTSAHDTNLYRSAANILKTDDHLAVAGRTVQLSNQKPDYYWVIPGSTDLDWKKIADVTMDTSLYSGHSFIVDVVDTMSNWGNSLACKKLRFYVSMARSGAVLDDQNTASVSGPVADYVRVVKTATGVYELQVRAVDTYRITEFHVRGLSYNGATATVTYADSPANGSAPGTAYTAAVTHTDYSANQWVSGTIGFGTTFGTVDTNLYRSAANTLKTDDSFVVGGANISVSTGYVEVQGGATSFFSKAKAAAVAGQPLLIFYNTTDSGTRFRIDEEGKVEWGANGVAIDTNLYRGAANKLRTDDTFEINGATTSISKLSTTFGSTNALIGTYYTVDAASRFIIRENGQIEWGGAGVAVDTILSRTAANTLSMGAGDKITQNAAPTSGDDLTNKTYVDLAVAAGVGAEDNDFVTQLMWANS